MQAATFIGYITIFSQLINPAKSFTTALYNIQKGMASMDRIQQVLDTPEAIRQPERPIAIKGFEREIEYRNVSFAYADGTPVLRDIDLTVRKGRTLAIVGQSGAGKTTLADLIPRFYDPTSGQVLIDGHDIRQYDILDLRNLLGIVTQDALLFNDTVFNNIAFGLEDVRQDDVERAARIANAHDFIMQMEQGYQTTIGDMGNKLSGGQRQRLSIARAVLHNPPILVLDEATSALDTESERLVQEALYNLMQHRTSIVIAHRLSTIQYADEIIVMQDGRIIERGNHIGLVAHNGVYRKLYEMQAFV
jgi:subfamily B ATP-binding cassette protein MsbA